MITPTLASEFAQNIDGAKQHGEWWSGRCPAHDDKNPSLSWKDGEDGKPVIVKCHAGCSRNAILASLGMEEHPPREALPPKKSNVAYPYYTIDGKYLAEKVRGYDDSGKHTTRWRRRNGKGGFISGRVKGELYLYGLPNLKNVRDGDTVYIAEGEKDVETLRKHGLVAVSGPDGAGHNKFPQEAVKWFAKKKVVIFQDNDEVGKAFAQDEAAAVSKVAESVKLIDLQALWPDIPEHADISDYLQRFGDGMLPKVLKLIDSTPYWKSSSEDQSVNSTSIATTSTTKFEYFSAESVLNEYIEPPQFIVQSLLAEGLTVLAGPPKYGKSFLSMDLCCSVATGKPFLGFSTVQSQVLYLCLEDSKGRIKKRLTEVNHDNLVAKNLFFVMNAPDMDNGLFDALEGFIKDHPDCKLIVIDTFQKIRGASSGSDYSYMIDSRDGGRLKSFADSHHLCLLVIHHTAKKRDEGDPFNCISGTTGLPGAADTNIVLLRNERMEGTTNMYISGRDVVEAAYSLKFNKDTHLWEFQGDAEEIENSFRKNLYTADDVVKTIKEAVVLGKGTWHGTMSDLSRLAEQTSYIGHSLGEPRAIASAVKQYADDLYRYDGISYTAAQNGTGGRKYTFTQANCKGLEKWVETDIPFDDVKDSN